MTKYRRKVLNDTISAELKEMFDRIGEKYGIECVTFNHDIDHIHVLFKAKPVTNLSKFLNAYKSATSRIVKRKYPEVREKLWEEKFWSHSFYLTDLRQAESILAYINHEMTGLGDDTFYIEHAADPETCRRVFHNIFTLMGQQQHYDMMMQQSTDSNAPSKPVGAQQTTIPTIQEEATR